MEILVIFLNLLGTVLNTCGFIGRLIVSVICFCATLIVSTLKTVVYSVQVLFEDFDYFAKDANHYLTDMEAVCESSLSVVVTKVKYVGKVVDNFLDGLLDGGATIIVSVASFCLDFIVLLVDSLLLIGSLIWMVPKTIAMWVYCYLFLIKDMIFATSVEITSTIETVTYAVTKLPYEALAGLLLGGLLLFINLKYKKHKQIWKLCRIFYKKYKKGLSRVLCDTDYYIEVCVWFIVRTIGLMFKTGRRSEKKLMDYLKDFHTKYVTSPSKVELMYQLEKQKEERLCVICYDRQRDTMLLTCRHMCMCQYCTHEIISTTGECPICRIQIQDYWNVYT